MSNCFLVGDLRFERELGVGPGFVKNSAEIDGLEDELSRR